MTPDFVWLTLACAALTFATRAGGYLVLSRIPNIPPRVEAALDAVPAAVMTALVAPAFFSGTWREAFAMTFCALLCLSFGLSGAVAAAMVALVASRHLV